MLYIIPKNVTFQLQEKIGRKKIIQNNSYIQMWNGITLQPKHCFICSENFSFNKYTDAQNNNFLDPKQKH